MSQIEDKGDGYLYVKDGSVKTFLIIVTNIAMKY